ncbi:MAG: 3-methyl-2-oxobutanoate dehydrogenase [Actinobacteria bacterium]|nr:3-methyl-2-oxobutanoate dehydrogenase [Actinomycetota bacterium]
MDDPLRIIGDGVQSPGGDMGLRGNALVKLFSWLVLLRTFDERAVALQRQGRIGTYPTFWGEEATQAGPLLALRDEDWVFPSYRQNAIGLLRGLPASVPLAYRRGYGGSHGFWNPRRYRVAPMCVPIGTHLPHAVGLAWAAKLRGEDLCSLVWFGDGATSEGDFHEAMNFASVFAAPVIFFCVNNQWAISTPFSRQSGTATVAEKAAAYAMPALRVDGFDPLACWWATREAAERALAGGGPTLIEAVTYRLGPHATADDPTLYRDESEAARYRSLEPVGRMAAYLRRQELLSAELEEEIRAEARAVLDQAVADMESIPQPGAEIMFEHLYAAPPLNRR